MFNRRTVLDLLVSCALITVADAAPANKKEHHNNGHSLLGAKLRQNGRHQIHKAAFRVMVEHRSDEDNRAVILLTGNTGHACCSVCSPYQTQPGPMTHDAPMRS